MRKVLIALAATAAAFASPAMANEGRIEARGGVVWDSGVSEDVWGVAAGYDWDLGDKAFAGLEISGDKIGASGTGLNVGLTARLGLKAGERTKVLVDGGYSIITCSLCDDPVHAGVALEQGVSDKVYLKLGYRHFFYDGFSDADAVVAGVGVKF